MTAAGAASSSWPALEAGGGPAPPLWAARADFKRIENVAPAAADALGLDPQRRGDVVKARHAQFKLAHAGEVADARALRGLLQRGPVRGHGLRRVFDAANGGQASVGAQRIIGVGMAGGFATDELRAPVEHAVQQAHGALMWNMRGDPRMPQRCRVGTHGVMLPRPA
jgi:hypothetical protein